MRIAALFMTVLLAAACGPGRTTYARYPGAPAAFDRTTQDQKAMEIADKVLAAAGGADKWTAAKQLRWSQSITHDGKEVLGGEQAWDRWNGRQWARARREGGDMIVMRPLYEAGGHAFIENPETKNLKKIDGGATEAIQAASERFDFDTAVMFMPFLLQEPGTKLSYAGEAQGDNEKIYDVLAVTFDANDPSRTSKFQIAIDRDTHMIARFEIQKKGRAENERLGYAVKEWQDAGGMKYPSTVQNIGLASEVVTYKDLKASAPEEDLFIPPPLM